jgi:protein-tyrosine phosphatase
LYRVLLVCAGNTCRSPLAAAALRRALGAAGRRVAVGSAGVSAAEGVPAAAPAVAVAERHGLDVGGHRARGLTAALVAEADLVLAMDVSQLEAVRRLAPAAAAKSHLLGDLGAGEARGIGVPDPFGGRVEDYEDCLQLITEHVERIAPIIRRAVESRAEAGTASRDKGVV